MNTKTGGSLLLLGCILVSSTLTYILTKAKYEKKNYPKPELPEEKTEKKPKPMKRTDEFTLQSVQNEKIDVTKYAEKYKSQYSSLVRDYGQENEKATYEIIDDDSFGTNGYEVIEFTLYADGVLTDKQKRIITDPENNVGRETIERFDELEHNGAVYVRNNKIETDFEILYNPKSYADLVGGSHAARA